MAKAVVPCAHLKLDPRPDNRACHRASTLQCWSLTLRGTGEQVLILTRSRQEARRWCIGSVPNVPKANHTSLWHVHRIVLASTVAVPTVQAKKLAYATRCSRCTLRWLQSMTLPGMVLARSRSCQDPAKWSSGRMQAGAPGNKVLLAEPSQKKTETSAQQSSLGSSSKPHLICFDCAFVYVFCLVCVFYLRLYHVGTDVL